jgi:hypothetical protein
MYEVCPTQPYLLPLTPCLSPTAANVYMSILPKCVCNVRAVEFAIAYRINDRTMDRCVFRVPRTNVSFVLYFL